MMMAYLFMAIIIFVCIVYFYYAVKRSASQLTHSYQDNFSRVRRVEIAQEEAMGRLTPSEARQLLNDLDQEVDSQSNQSRRFFSADVSLARWTMFSVVALSVLGSVSLYQQLGYATEVAFTEDLRKQQLTPEKITRFLQYRSERYERIEDWYFLATDYMNANKNSEAVSAFEKALEKPSQNAQDHLALLVEYAQAIFYANDNQSSPKMLAVVEAILQQDPTQAIALDLKGVAAFSQQNYLGAVLAWQEAIRYSPRSLERLALLSAIAKARQRGRIDYQQVAPIITHQLAVKIEWDESDRKWQPDDVLLVYAVIKGQKMPVAIQRIFPDDLNQPILLTNLDALMPTVTLAETETVDLMVKLSSIHDKDLTKGRIIGIKESLLINTKEIFAINVAL